MIVHIDAKSLEWICILWLAQDKVGIDELITSFKSGISIHDTNKERFKLPSKLIAKTFVFRQKAEVKLCELGELRVPTTPN